MALPDNQYFNTTFMKNKRGLNKNFSFYGNNFSNENEINVYKSLQQEQIQIFGIEVTYVVRTTETVDRLFGENVNNTFTHSFKIEMFPRDTSISEGSDNIMPFGWNVSDTAIFHCSLDRLIDEIAKLNIPDRTVPMVGDLLILENLSRAAYEIKFVEDKLGSIAMNSYQMYSLSCQIFDFSNEKFDTGIKEIDIIGDYHEIYVEPKQDNENIQTEADEYIIKEPNIWPSLFND